MNLMLEKNKVNNKIKFFFVTNYPILFITGKEKTVRHDIKVCVPGM